jgi:hypothetical protein
MANLESNQNIKLEIVKKVLDADFKNIVEKVRNGKTLTATERKTLEQNRGQEKWEVLDISRSAFFKYKKLGMPEQTEEAKEWLQVRAGLAKQGSGKIEIGGKTFEAQDLIDLKGQLMEGQAENIALKNRIEKLNVLEREGKLVDADEAQKVLLQVLYPLKKALEQMPENLCNALNPNDPSRAEAILEKEINQVFEDLQKNFKKNKQTENVRID